jgi:hypothetical protein
VPDEGGVHWRESDDTGDVSVRQSAMSGMVWCPSYPLDRNRCDQVVAAGSGAG